MPCTATRLRRRVLTLGIASCAITITLSAFPLAAHAGTPQGATQSGPPAPALPRVPAAPAGGAAEYRVGAEDVLKIAVLEAPDLNQEVRVSASGEISVLLGGTLTVEGLTTRQVERALGERLQEKYIRNPHVSVQVTEARSHTVSVMGAVNQPGVFEVRGAKSVLEVLALAEGLAEDAGDTVLVVRADSTQPVAEVRLSALMAAKDSNLNVAVRPGDVVKVNRQGVIYVVGDVQKPGAFAIQGGRRTALHALALSEGLTSTSAPKKATILRTNAQGERGVLAVDLDSLMKGKSPDVSLQPEDVLFVPTSGAKSFGRAFKDFALMGLRIAFVW
jgi:polysaccharide export outer membrane protein